MKLDYKRNLKNQTPTGIGLILVKLVLRKKGTSSYYLQQLKVTYLTVSDDCYDRAQEHLWCDYNPRDLCND